MKESQYMYSPSTEKVVPEEADDPKVRASADFFVDQLYRLMDKTEYGPNAMVPTPQEIKDRYAEVESRWHSSSGELFSIPHALGAVKRKLLHERELATRAMEISRDVNVLSMGNIGNLYTLLVAFELNLPEDQRPSNEIIFV